MRLVLLLVLASTLCMAVPVSCTAAEKGSALKADEIKAEPYRDAKAVGKLAAGDKVDIVKREGGWYLISSPKKGWVRMLSIRLGTAAAPGVKPSGVSALATGRAGTGNVVSSTGVRGLSEEELKKAQFDEEELKRVDSFTTSKDDAGRFAGKASLSSRSVPYMK